ncbi:MAG TPA: hypothetical protein VNN74_02750 [Candidatus Micrarchaeia archaeon]|nr:hypothetical protein [Candidatus Micrarchaeia archaeon]
MRGELRQIGPGGKGWDRRLAIIPLGLAAVLAAVATTTATAQPRAGGAVARRSAAVAPAVVRTAMESVRGHRELVLTTAASHTLYFFKPDTASRPACTGGCAATWPPFRSAATRVSHPSSVRGRFTFHRGANGRQLEYNGHPLYTYSGDRGPRQDHGEGFLGKWFVATPGLRASAPPKGKPTATPKPYGY